MKKIILFLVIGVIVFSLARSHSQAFNIQFNNSSAQNVGRPFVVEVVETDGSVSKEYRGVSANSDPFKISEDLGAGPFIEDRFKAFPDIKMDIGSKITLYRAPVIKIKDGKRSKTVRSWTKTVGELFTEQKVEIGKDDKVNFTNDTAVENNMEIAITRVAITTVIEKEAIEYSTTKKDDSTLDKGKTKVKQAGQEGTKELSYRVVREDGDEVSRKLIKTETTKEPVEEILLIGTRPVITVRCKFNDTVIEAALKYPVDADSLCTLMMKESNGNPQSGQGTDYQGLFQYTDGFWASASAKAGFSGASIWDARAQIFSTAWAFSHGERKRWP